MEMEIVSLLCLYSVVTIPLLETLMYNAYILVQW